MSTVNPPSERTCERCGRRDVWDDDATGWRIADGEDGKQAGEFFCLHEWDINGSYRPFE